MRAAASYAAEGDAVMREQDVRRTRAPRVHALLDEARAAHTNAANEEEERRVGRLLFVVQEVAAAGSEVSQASTDWFREELRKAKEAR